uniref:tetrahydrofolate synthase n=1 Tax=Oryctolagus cuniculus TaxID=9986 RepID=A0A5F9CDM9_RABIT
MPVSPHQWGPPEAVAQAHPPFEPPPLCSLGENVRNSRVLSPQPGVHLAPPRGFPLEGAGSAAPSGSLRVLCAALPGWGEGPQAAVFARAGRAPLLSLLPLLTRRLRKHGQCSRPGALAWPVPAGRPCPCGPLGGANPCSGTVVVRMPCACSTPCRPTPATWSRRSANAGTPRHSWKPWSCTWHGAACSSPHLVQVRERIRINGQPISRELFTKHFWRLYQRLEETKDGSYVSMPAYFRFLTLMAFHVFLQEKVDLAVVEVGIGGAYDCTNIIRKPVVCGVSSLGVDHTSILGDTMEKIAWQKGGIFKCPLYLCPPLEALEDGGPPLSLGLEGEHQRSNAALALQLAHCWLQQQDHQDVGELTASSRPSVMRQLPLAPAFQPTARMRHGLRDTEWLGRTQVLRRGPLTWYLDGAHTTSSVQACVRWFLAALRHQERQSTGPEVRVLLFNSTGDRDPAALLKVLQPCQFDYAVFCPNLTERSLSGDADQQNFMVTLDQVLHRCLEHQQHWSRLDDGGRSAPSPEPAGPEPLLLAPPPAHPGRSTSLVFGCISHALQWISQGRDPVFQPPSPPGGRPPFPVAGSKTRLLREAAAIHVLVTGSLHLVGGVLKLLDPSLSQ